MRAGSGSAWLGAGTILLIVETPVGVPPCERGAVRMHANMQTSAQGSIAVCAGRPLPARPYLGTSPCERGELEPRKTLWFIPVRAGDRTPVDFPRIRIGLLPVRRGTASDARPGRSRPGFDPVRAGNASILPPPGQCFWWSPVRAGKRQISAKQRVVKEVDPRALEGTAVSVQPVLNRLP